METANRHAHSLKGVAANIGAHGVRDAAAELEEACADCAAADRIEACLAFTIQRLDLVISGLEAVDEPPAGSGTDKG